MVQFLPAPDISGQLAPLLQGIQQLGAGIGQRRQQQQQQEGLQALARQLGLDPNAIEDLKGLGPELKLKGIETLQKGQQLQQERDDIELLFGDPTRKNQAPNAVVNTTEPTSTAGTNITNLSDEQLVSAAAHPNARIRGGAKAEQERRTNVQKQNIADRKFAREESKDFLKTVSDSEDDLRRKRQALELQKNSLETGNVGFFSLDNVANITGIEALRSAKGAQFITAGKEFLLSNISRAGSRPNQWIEQQISTALPKVGRSREANETVRTALETDVRILEKRNEIVNELKKQGREELGFVPGNIEEQVRERMKPIIEEEEKRMAFKLRETFEEEQGDKKLSKLKKVPIGTPLTPKMAGILMNKWNDSKKVLSEAKRIGFEVPTQEEIERFQS